VNIDGGDGLDTVVVIGTEFNDDFVVTEDGVYGAGLNVSFVGIEVLRVDGAEGDDRFFVLSTGENFITEIFGGLGSDTFNMSGDTPPVISNDLLGHSGIITHSVEGVGADYDDLTVVGISANVADNDEPAIRITETGGFTVVGENGLHDTYTVVLTRQPRMDVYVKVLAPVQTPEEEAYGWKALTVRSEHPDANNEDSVVTLKFTPENWFMPQTVIVEAPPDGKAEGVRFGAINHIVIIEETIVDNGNVVSATANTLTAASGTFTDLENLEGATVEITGGAGKGQVRVIESWTGNTLTLYTEWNEGGIPDVTSTFVIKQDDSIRAAVTSNVVDTFQDSRARFPVQIIDLVGAIVTITGGTGVGQSKEIVRNTVNTITVTEAWDITPDETSKYKITRDGETVIINGVPVIGTVTSIVTRVFEVEDGDFPVTDLENEFNGLRGATIEIVDGAGLGQMRIIESSTQDSLTVTTPWRTELDGSTVFVIRRYDGLALPSVTVKVNDEDQAGVVITRKDNSTDVIEGATGEIYGATDTYTVALTREPAADVVVTVTLDDQVDLGAGAGVPITLTFTTVNWNIAQAVTVTAYDDDVREGFHHGYITHSVSSTDIDIFQVTLDSFTPEDETSVLLSHYPLSDQPVTVTVDDVALEPAFFELSASTIIFLDEDGWPEQVSGDVVVAYSYLIPGYDGVEVERVVANIADNDTPGVLITESGGSTDVIESDNLWADIYTVVLTKKPDAEVTINVTPQPTRTTRGSLVTLTEQVRVSSEYTGAVNNSDGSVTLTFTPNNWNDPQTVTVSAIDDWIVDGGDTKVFAPTLHTVNDIKGPLFVDGCGGEESLAGLTPPVMLPGETNLKKSTGEVVEAVDLTTLTVHTADVEPYGSLLYRTVEITRGLEAGVGQFRLIMSYAHNEDDTTTLTLNDPWDLEPGDLVQITEYAITNESLNFFVDETEQVDFLTVFHEDSVADNIGYLEDSTVDGYEKRIRGLGMSPDTVIGGQMRPGGITYGNLEVVEVNLGSGNDEFNVNDTHSREDSFQTWTMLNTGPGDDNVTVALDAETDGLFALNTQEGDDTIDASGSTLPLVIFGWDGSDGITGGQGNDIIFGDRGRVDYLKERKILTDQTATAVTETTLQDDSEPFPEDNALEGYFVRITDSIGTVHVRRILSNTTTELTVSNPWTIVYGECNYEVFEETPEVVTRLGATPEPFTGNVTGASETTLIVEGEPFPTADEGLRGSIVWINDGMGTGQSRLIVSNTEDMLTLDTPWSVLPDETSRYRITGRPSDQTDGEPLEPRLLFTVDCDTGGGDIIRGGGGEDILIGGAAGDVIDGNEGADLIFGDNVKLDRRGDYFVDFTNPRFRALQNTLIYDTGDNDLVDHSEDYENPAGPPAWANWEILMSEPERFNAAGNDYIAGGPQDDTIFGQLGDDTIQGDGSIAGKLAQNRVEADRDSEGSLTVYPSFEAETDGDDYIEGNGGDDVIFGNLGQDDIIGGSSDLFSLLTPGQRPDGSDLIFGGAGTDVSCNNPGDESDDGHAQDGDMILGDNGNIFRLVDSGSGQYLTFAYDDPDFDYSGDLKIIPRAAKLLDYHIGGPDYLPNTDEIGNDIGAPDEIHGESGDDFIYGMVGDDILFGEGQDDDIIGGYGNDWISGGTGDDGVLGDDGRIYTSRNGTAEPLYGIGDLAGELDQYICTPGNIQQATINVSGELRKTVNLTPFKLGDPEVPQHLDDYDPEQADDIIFGGWGDDSLHGGDGDDAISGAEALAEYCDIPTNPGDVLKYGFYQAGEFGAYDEYDPWSRVYWNPETGEFVTGGDVDFILNFDHTEGAVVDTVHTDGDDVIFGDLGNDWLVGGTGRDHMYGGRGCDLLNADDNLDTAKGFNTEPDGPEASYMDIAYGGAGRDVLIANTGGDRLIDWAGEFNSYIVQYAPFGVFTVSRAPQPQLFQYLYDLSWSDGGDPTIPGDTSADPARRGEPEGELGLVTQRDVDWQEQTGAPADPQPGNIPGGARDVLRSATFNSGNMEAFVPDSGVWTVESGALRVSAETLGGDAAAVFHVPDMLPQYFEIQATITMVKPTAGWKANSYVIFDYYSPTDFKFAGLNASIDKIQMGHRDETGWIVDVQSKMKIKPGEFYNILVAINGTTVTLMADNREYFSHTFEPHVIDGWVYGLNSGMVGFGSNNSRGVYDNIAVQVLPPEITFEGTEEFPDSDAAIAFVPSAGDWQTGGGRYDGTPATNGTVAISLVDLGLDHGFEVASILEIETTLNTENTAGLVFDYYGPENFKFAAIDAVAGKAVIGHFTSKSGWVTDATFDIAIEPGVDYDLNLSLKGSTVNLFVKETKAKNWQAMVGHVYNAVTVDGDFGFLSRDGASSFDAVSVKTNDPAFRVEEGGANLMASSVSQESVGVEAFLTDEALAPIVEAAMERWTAFGINKAMLARLRGVSFRIVDLDGLTLSRVFDDKVFIDIDGAGHGWFIDSTPYNDAEFKPVAESKSAAYGDVDLLTAVMHELGHVLGLKDLNPEAADMMSSTLDTGVRQLNIEDAFTILLL